MSLEKEIEDAYGAFALARLEIKAGSDLDWSDYKDDPVRMGGAVAAIFDSAPSLDAIFDPVARAMSIAVQNCGAFHTMVDAYLRAGILRFASLHGMTAGQARKDFLMLLHRDGGRKISPEHAFVIADGLMSRPSRSLTHDTVATMDENELLAMVGAMSAAAAPVAMPAKKSKAAPAI